jgi:putative ABC transport system substrate-binding protein
VALSQQSAKPVIGYLSAGTEIGGIDTTAAFRAGLGEQGFVEGPSVEILYRYAETHYDRLPALATDLARRGVFVIVATGGNVSALAAKSATTTIPIVFATAADPVELGLVASLNRPGGNLTGATFLIESVLTKRLELLHAMVPAASSIGFLVNPTNTTVEAQVKEVENAARVLGVRLVILNVSTPSDIEAVFANLGGKGIGALQMGADPLFFSQRDKIAGLALRNGMPAISANHEFVEAGGLVSYGARISDVYRLAGTYAGRILRGEKPADLPVQRPTRIETVLNLKTANALGLTIPETLLATADEVIQ